ncbi:hypothetical protein GH714_015580 [Hevea brasiliensis]|uniref:DUF4408 domain-containing protein n=1 Tax=Hevea brasiliensis TaxID=3981 RepID=A0A6A6NHQ2_HEVBR|nr:hypothetical protein GH714_015580 [Hevea brasiliensis]
MSSFEFDIVKAEKADAMRRYKRERIYRFSLPLAGAFTLLFCSFSWLPVVHEMAKAYLSVLNHHLLVFLLINAMVLVIYHLSAAAAGGKNDSASQPDLYDQYVSFSFSPSSRRRTTAEGEKQLVVVSPAAVEVQPDENTFHNKQIVHYENANCAPVEKNPVNELAVTETYKADSDETKSFRRTRSEKYAIEKIKRSQRRELRRSGTENGREMVVAGGRTLTRKSMQEMNSEEFRHTIESFIASKRKILRDENFAVSMEEKESSFNYHNRLYVI